jgi:hypothetical protein
MVAFEGVGAGCHVLSPRKNVVLLAVPVPRFAAGTLPVCKVVPSLNVTPVPFSDDGIFNPYETRNQNNAPAFSRLPMFLQVPLRPPEIT